MWLQSLLISVLVFSFCRPALGWTIIGKTDLDHIFGISNILEDDYPDTDPSVKADENLSTPQLIKKYGYPCEIHYVTTEDGYILEVHRIPMKGATPVLLVHGLLDASSTWVMMGPNKGFAYQLADEKYDVWMANVRGNTYSVNHTTLNPKKAEFWQFSFHEMGIYDIPATIDYVLQVSNFTNLHYVGHSQGTTCFWIMCSQRPEYNERIISMQALAPAAFIGGCKSPIIEFMAFFRRTLNILLKLIGAHEFLPSNTFLKRFSEYVCQDKSVVQEVCSQVMFVIAGFDEAQMNHTMLPVILGHTPAGASTKQLLHFGQLKSSGHFRQYDHGYIDNLRKYRSLYPPDYNLKNVTAKVALHYGANDWLTIPADVERLHQALPNVLGKFLVKFSEFNHLDFVWGIDARELVYNKVINLMRLIELRYL